MRWALVLLLAHVTRARRSKILPVKRSSQDGGYFESCGPNHADEGVHQLVETVKHSEQTSDFCARGAGTVVWPPDGSEKGAFCCPWGATWCGGCAEPNLEGTACKRCRGGWVLDSGHCTACADMAWHDSEGRNCYGVAEASACSGQPFHGLSANTACCACGGGLRVATSFGYYTEPILVGDSRVVGHPLPRTAERYSVDSTCQLLKFNLTLDGTTGELKLAPHCSTFGCGGAQGDFSVTCTITAHEGELSTSAMLRVSGSKWMVWESEALIVPSGSKKIFPARVSGIVPEAALEGEEAQDPPDPPEAAHRRTKSSELTLACLPRSSSDWLELSESGELSVSNEHPEAVELPGLTDLGFTGLQDASGSVCEVQRIGNRTTVLALVPQSWSSIRYPYEAVSVDLNNSLHPALEPQDGGRTPGRVAPSRFSASCATDQAAIRVDFDELTGLATAWGYGIFHLDIQTGSLQISPEANLSAIFDDVLLDQSRAAVRLSCTVLGHYEWQVGVPVAPIKGEIEILVEDSTCWTPALHSPHGWAVVEQMKSSASQCRAACRADATCAVYSWAGKCQFLSPCGPRPVNCQSFPTAVEKIVGCSIGRSCVNLTAETFVWRYGGVFCPVALGEAKGGRLSWVYQKQNMATVEDIIYLQASETDPSVRCGAGGLLLTRSNKSWDFENMTSHYIELFGEHVACLELSGGGNTIQTVFRQGEAQLKVSQATDDVGKNLCLILVPQHCEAPRLLSNAQAEADEEGLLAEAVMIDDPSTSIPNDYSLHPCDCFPVSWGVHSPVTSQSFASVVPGSGNQFTPDLVYLLEGSYMCPQAGYLTHMSAVDLNGCQQACQITVNCSYFWFGSASEVLQCRLYQTCPSLVLLNGASGVLAALVKGQACHRANPEKCWSFSKRREFLGAGTGSDRQLATSSECLFQSLLEECDLMQLIGGLGVQQCSSCAFAPLSWRDTWTQKRRLPETLRGGARLSFTCWAERYRAVPEEPGVPSDPYVAQCAGKHWWGEPFSEPGLHFACGACVQIVPVDYSDFLDQDAQELYFLPNLQVQIGVDQANPLMLTVNGKLFDVTWEPPPEPQLMRLELQSRGAVLRHKGGTGGCLHWIDGKVILSPSCQLWCPRTSVSGCVAREDHVFLCVGAIACLDWQNSTWTVREVPDSPSCPISFQRSTAFAAGPDEASALLQLRHGGMERIAACSEAWQWPPQPLLARFSPQSAGASQHANVRWIERRTIKLLEECLQFNGNGSLAVGSCQVNASFSQASLFESLMAQRLAQGLWVIGDFSDSLPEVKAEQEGSFFSMLYYKNCLNYAVNNFSFSDPYVWWESEKKAHYPSYYLGCGLSSTKNATKFEPPDHFVDPTPELEAWGVPIVHFMHGARCVDAARSWWSFGEVKLSLKDCEEMNGQQAFLWAPGQVALTIAKYPFGRNCLYFSLSDQEVQVGKCDWLSKNNVPLKWSEDLMALWAGEYCWQASGELEMVKCKDLPLAGGGIARQELPWFAMNCPAGSLITSVQTRFLELTVHYRCKEMMFIGSCTEWITPNFASTDRAMMEARISCPSPDMGLQSTLASAPAGTMSGAASVSVRYRCCYTGPLVTSIALQRDAKLSWAQSRFNDYNGVYCPQRRDDTGRLQYEQSSSFRPSTTPKGLLAFDAVKGQWCLDWQGRRRRPLGCVDTYVAEPLDGAGLRTDAGGWSTVAVSDFNAELENLGIQTGRPPAFHQQALAPSQVPKRPKPSLLTFTSQIPGLGPAPECKTLVPDWRMVGEGLSKENPCYFVSGETADPAAEEPEVGEGASWTERTDDATDEGDTDAGFSYEKILGCFDRSIKRQLKLNHAIKEFSSNQLIGDTVLGVVRATCAWLASVAVAPVGFGSIVQTGEICQALVDSSQGVEGSVVQWQKDSKADSIYKADSEDCAGDQAAFSRLWCDIHCVKDAVNQGNRALRISLENAVRVLTGNMDRLTEHQSQLMVDQFDALRADLFPNAELPGVELQRFLVSKVRSIQALLFQPLDAAGQDVTGRAVRALSTELSSWTGDGPNVTHLLNKAETVHAAVKLTKQRHGLGRLQALTRNIGRAAVAIQDLARAQSHELGVYNHSSFAWKERQEQLLKSSVDRFEGDALFRDVGSVGASPVLLELDSTWWSLRATLDKYLSSAKRYAQAMGEVASMLQSYTSCSIQYAPVHGSFSHLMKAEKEHRKALDEAWSSAVPMTGLLVSKLVDSNAFVKLSIEDAKAAYELLHSEKQLCNEPGESGAKRAGQVLNQTLQQGLVGQTERQLATLFQELHLLQGRLPPSSDAENADVLQQSALRAQYAIRAARPFHQALAHQSLRMLCDSREK